VAKSAVNRTLGATRGQGKASKAPAPAAASGGKRRGVKLGGNRPGTSAPQGTIAKGSVNRSLGAVRGYGKGSKAAAPAKSKTPSKMGKSAKNQDARKAYKDAARKVRAVSSVRNKVGASVRNGKALIGAKNSLQRTELQLSGKKKELRAFDRQQKKNRQIENKMVAARSVSNAKDRAAGTVRGKIAAVKRFLTGSKRNRK
jgi:hypothetical protein